MSTQTSFSPVLALAVSHQPAATPRPLTTAAGGESRLAPLPANDRMPRCGQAVLAAYADHPSAYLALNAATRHFTSPVADGFIAYRAWGGYLYQFGNVFAPPADQAALLAAFCTFARQQRKRVCAVQLRAQDIALYQQAGFRLNQLGSAYTLDLRAFTLAGTKFMNLRNKIRRARKEGIQVVEAGVELAFSAEHKAQLERLSAHWLKSKGRWKKLLDFMVGELEDQKDTAQRLFLAMHQEQIVAFIRYVPSYGRWPGWLHDLTRRVPDAPPGVMDLLNVTAIERFQAEGAPYLHFGFTPSAGLTPATDNIEGRSPAIGWILRQLNEHGAAIYPAQSQVDYKLKWGPQIITPEYIAYQGSFRLSNVWSLLRLTRAI